MIFWPVLSKSFSDMTETEYELYNYGSALSRAERWQFIIIISLRWR